MIRFSTPLLEETVQRLRDIHLLIYLNTLIDKGSSETLMKCLSVVHINNNEIILPSSLAMVLNLVKDSLQFEDSDDE